MISTPAFLGATPILSKSDIVHWCPITDADRAAIGRVLDRNELAGRYASETCRLQEEWAAYLGIKHALLTNSGTAALHMALAAVGVGPGDEVIVPAYTFVASASAVLHQNALPVFADLEPGTLSISPNSIADKISSRTKAIVLVHLNGIPGTVDSVLEIARSNGLKVVEDACQAHGAEYAGRKVGTFGHAAAFSLNKSKNLPGGEGGLFVTNDTECAEIAARVYSFGDIYDTDGLPRYDAHGMGWMYRSTEFVAALTRARLTKLDDWNKERRRNVCELNNLLDGLPGIRIVRAPPDSVPAFWRYVFQVVPEDLDLSISPAEFRKMTTEALIAEGLPISEWQKRIVPHQKLFNRMEGYGGGCPWKCAGSNLDYQNEKWPVAQDVVDRSLWLREGIQPFNSLATVHKIAAAIQRVIHSAPLLAQRKSGA